MSSRSLKQILLVGLILFVHLELFLHFGRFDSLLLLAFFVAVLFLKFRELLQPALLFLLIHLVVYFPKPLTTLPALPFLVPFFLSILLLLPLLPLRVTLSWLQKGTLDKTTWLLLILTGLLSSLALIIWAVWSDNLGAGLQMVQGFSAYPTWLILSICIPLFALVNAFAEEVVYRGVLQEALLQIFQVKEWVLLLQAAAFAAAHFAAGFPNGLIGYVMVFCYGIMLGFLRLRSRGLLAPYLAHVIADLTIGYCLGWQVLQ